MVAGIQPPDIAVNGDAAIIYGPHPGYPESMFRYAVSCDCGVSTFDLISRGDARKLRAWDWVRAATEHHKAQYPACECLGPHEEFVAHLN